MIFTNEGLFEVAIESWPERDLSPQPPNSFQKLSPTELSGHDNCFLSFTVFLISNCQFHLSFSFSHRSDVLFSSTNIQIIFPSICRWMLISFFPTHPEMTQADRICNGFHYGIFSQIGTVEQGKFLFKHLYCQNAGN